MTELPRHLGPLEELRYALAEADAEQVSHGLTDRVLAAALEARSPGTHSAEPPEIGPLEAFRRAAESLDRLLRPLGIEQWRAPALRDLDVQGLVGHLIGVEGAFISALEHDPLYDEDADHVASTAHGAWSQAGRAPAGTLSDWQEIIRRSLELAAPFSPATSSVTEALGSPLGLHGIHLPLGPLLVVRAFELWTHEEDIRRAIGIALAAPDAQSLRLMTNLAFELLPVPMSAVMPSTAARTTKIVLTGDGGRTWLGPSGGDADGVARPHGEIDVRIVMDAVDFCRLAANRMDLARVPATITGDLSKAHDLFLSTTKLALD